MVGSGPRLLEEEASLHVQTRARLLAIGWKVKVSLCLLGFCGILLWNRGDAFRLSMDVDENMEKFGTWSHHVVVYPHPFHPPLSGLIQAAKSGNVSQAKFFIDKGAKIDAQEKRFFWHAPLHWAAKEGHLAMLKFLVTQGADVDLKTKILDDTPLSLAVQEGHLEAAKYLAEQGADLDWKRNTFTLFHLAASKGQLEVAKWLLDEGADTNAKGKIYSDDSYTPLHYAAVYGHRKMAEWLVHKGTQVDAKTSKDADTPLLLAIRHGHEQMAKWLLTQKADFNAQNEDGFRPLHYAAMNGQLEVVQCLVDKHAAAVVKDKYGNTPLIYAATGTGYPGERVAIAKLLVKSGANVHTRSHSGEQPLHRAAQYGLLELTKYFVAIGAQLNAQTDSGEQPLHRAAAFGHLEVVKWLVNHEVQVDVKTKLSQTPLWWAANKGHLHTAEWLVEHGADVNATNNNLETPLYAAAWVGHEDVAQYLVKKEAAVNAKSTSGDSPLLAAVNRGHLSLAKFLVDHAAKVNDQNNAGWTPLHYAAKLGYLEMAKELVDKGADVTLKTDSGDTILHIAARHQKWGMSEFLLQQVKDNLKDTDLEEVLRAEQGSPETQKFLSPTIIDLAKKEAQDIKDGSAPKILKAALGTCYPKVAVWAANSSYGLDSLPPDATTARSCLLSYLSYAQSVELAKRSLRSYLFPIGGVVAAVFWIYIFENCLCNDSALQEVDPKSDFFQGAFRLVATGATKWQGLKTFFRFTEVMTVVAGFLGFMMVPFWWKVWLPLMGFAFFVPAWAVWGFKDLLQSPVTCVAASNSPRGYGFAILRLILICALSFAVWKKTDLHRAAATGQDMFKLDMDLFVNPLLEGLKSKAQYMWSESTLGEYSESLDKSLEQWGFSPNVTDLLPKKQVAKKPIMHSWVTKVHHYGYEESIVHYTPVRPPLPGPSDTAKHPSLQKWIAAKIAPVIAPVSAQSVAMLGLWFLTGCLGFYASGLLLRLLCHLCPKKVNIFNVEKYAKQLAEAQTEEHVREVIKDIGNSETPEDDFGKLQMYAKQLTEAERVEEEIKEINDKEPGLQIRSIGGCGLFWRFFFVILDFYFDFNTIVTLILSSNLYFAGFLTFIVARSSIREINTMRQEPGLCQAFSMSMKRGMLHRQLIYVLDEEKGAEAFFSLAITSYSYVFCVQTVDQALKQWGSIISSAFQVAGFLVEMEMEYRQLPEGKSGTFTLLPFQEKAEDSKDPMK